MLLSHASDIKKSFKAQTSDNFDYNKQEKNLEYFSKKIFVSVLKKSIILRSDFAALWKLVAVFFQYFVSLCSASTDTVTSEICHSSTALCEC